MQYQIAHELPGRIRLRCGRDVFSYEESQYLQQMLSSVEGAISIESNHITGSLLIHFDPEKKQEILSYIDTIEVKDIVSADFELTPFENSTKYLYKRIFSLCFHKVIRRILSFTPLKVFVNLYTVIQAIPFIKKGLQSLLNGKVTVEVLDGTSIGISLLRKNYGTMSSIMFLLRLGDMIGEWTRSRARLELAASLSMNIDKVWVEENGKERMISMDQVQVGDVVLVRAGAVIPLDGIIDHGAAMVNQAHMTGEAMSVAVEKGKTVFAGTVIEDGAVAVRITSLENETRIHKIIELVEESEEQKAMLQSRAEHLADRIVPFSFIGAGLIFLLTRNVNKALSVLLVDYSCAIKLTTPIAVMSAMREGSKYGALIKGGRYLEVMAEADTIVFDKTGTLTTADPTVNKVIPFGKYSEDEVLCMAACLEEHFPHTVAAAVVRAAEEKNILHEERHTEPEYIVAHGIVASLDGQRVLIGSSHFVFEDEGVTATPEQKLVIESETSASSLLFLAVENELAGIICVNDYLREETEDVIKTLRLQGFQNIIMLTGDSENVAKSIAAQIGLDDYRSQVLPEDKAGYIKSLKEAGKKVVMVGDGINDSPALAAADLGISMKSGSDIAREVSDIALIHTDLTGIPVLRALSKQLVGRISKNYAIIVGLNSSLILGGVFGLVSPAVTSALHNLSTVVLSGVNMTPLVEKKDILYESLSLVKLNKE